MSQLGITAVNVFIEINGKQHIAPIKAESADLFVGMLSSYQGGGTQTNLVTLPDSVSKHLMATRKAILDHLNSSKTAKKSATASTN